MGVFFLIKDPCNFIEYALRDALIALVHAYWMEDLNFSLGGLVRRPTTPKQATSVSILDSS